MGAQQVRSAFNNEESQSPDFPNTVPSQSLKMRREKERRGEVEVEREGEDKQETEEDGVKERGRQK